MMFGVILFLRLGVISSAVGIAPMLGIIGLSLVFMLITSISIAAVASSRDVGAGGVYYLISRTLGIECGSALGLALIICQICSMCLTVSGFSVLFHEIYPQFSITVIEITTIILLTLTAVISSNLALKTQGIIFAILIIAILNVFLGQNSQLPPMESIQPFYENLSFFGAFTLFYAALTGIEAGMALSGNLKTPVKSLLWGNVSSVIFAALTYGILVIFMHLNVSAYHLSTDPFVLVDFSYSKEIMYVGIFAATLSSALGSLMAAPRIMQIMAQDGVFPKVFAKTYGKYQEPRLALFSMAFVTMLMVIYTHIDQIIPILSMICLISYSLLNFIAAINAYMNTVSWRPDFKLPYILPTIGFIMGLTMMFMINASLSILSIIIIMLFYIGFRLKSIDTSFSDLRNSIIFFLSRYALYNLSKREDNVLTWHPIAMLLAISPRQHMNLCKLIYSLTKHNGLFVFGSTLPDDTTPERLVTARLAIENHFKKHKLKVLVEMQTSENTIDGFLNLVQSYGMGRIQPNTIFWPIIDNSDLNDDMLSLFSICYQHQKNIVLFKDSSNKKKKNSILSKKINNVDIWWHAEARESFNVSLHLVSLLFDSNSWHKPIMTIHASVNDHNAISDMQNHLQEFVSNSYHKAHVKVHIEPEGTNNFQSINNHNISTNLLFVPLSYDEANQDELLSNIKKTGLIEKNNEFPVIFCCALDNLDHQDIYI